MKKIIFLIFIFLVVLNNPTRRKPGRSKRAKNSSKRVKRTKKTEKINNSEKSDVSNNQKENQKKENKTQTENINDQKNTQKTETNTPLVEEKQQNEQISDENIENGLKEKEQINNELKEEKIENEVKEEEEEIMENIAEKEIMENTREEEIPEIPETPEIPKNQEDEDQEGNDEMEDNEDDEDDEEEKEEEKEEENSDSDDDDEEIKEKENQQDRKTEKKENRNEKINENSDQNIKNNKEEKLEKKNKENKRIDLGTDEEDEIINKSSLNFSESKKLFLDKNFEILENLSGYFVKNILPLYGKVKLSENLSLIFFGILYLILLNKFVFSCFSFRKKRNSKISGNSSEELSKIKKILENIVDTQINNKKNFSLILEKLDERNNLENELKNRDNKDDEFLGFFEKNVTDVWKEIGYIKSKIQDNDTSGLTNLNTLNHQLQNKNLNDNLKEDQDLDFSGKKKIFESLPKFKEPVENILGSLNSPPINFGLKKNDLQKQIDIKPSIADDKEIEELIACENLLKGENKDKKKLLPKKPKLNLPKKRIPKKSMLNLPKKPVLNVPKAPMLNLPNVSEQNSPDIKEENLKNIKNNNLTQDDDKQKISEKVSPKKQFLNKPNMPKIPTKPSFPRKLPGRGLPKIKRNIFVKPKLPPMIPNISNNTPVEKNSVENVEKVFEDLQNENFKKMEIETELEEVENEIKKIEDEQSFEEIKNKEELEQEKEELLNDLVTPKKTNKNPFSINNKVEEEIKEIKKEIEVEKPKIPVLPPKINFRANMPKLPRKKNNFPNFRPPKLPPKPFKPKNGESGGLI